MNRILTFFLVIFLIACAAKDVTPKGVLSKEKMSQVLWDVIRADQFYAEFISRDSLKAKGERFRLYEEAYKVHGITQETFQKSYHFYSTHPDQLKTIFDTISARATRETPSIYKPRILKDSITAK